MASKKHQNSLDDLKQAKPYAAGLDLECEAIDLIHKVGTSRSIQRTVESEETVGAEHYGVKPHTTIDVDAMFESVDEGIYVTGTASSTISGECSRCLDDISEDVTVRFDELFTYPEKIPAELEEDEVPILESDMVDLGPLVHDAFAIAAPFNPLCDEDCLGLCGQCGFRMDEDPDHDHVIIDPRFAALAGMFEGADAGSASEDEEDAR